MTHPSRRLLSAEVAAAVCLRWPGIGAQWCAQVEHELTELCDRYNATVVAVMHSRYGLVVEASANGTALVFRSSPDPAGVHQTRTALALAELGVGPTVYEVIETPIGTWTVTQRIFPGTPIGDMDLAEIDLETICASLRPLVGQPAPSPNMPTLTSWLRSRLTDHGLTDLAPGRQRADFAERQQALAILDDLEVSGVDGLCHGDASPWNILLNGDHRVMLIDPRGLCGDVAFDAAVIALKAADTVPPATTVPYLAREVGIDPERVAAWVVVADAACV